MKTVRIYCMYGLGGRMWSAGIEDVLAANLRRIPNVICPPTRSFTQWREIVSEIKATPDDIHGVIGHSMGGASATYVTDYVKVDLVVLYDLAGQPPSKIGKNTGRVIDIYDTIPDLVPEWRVQAVAGHEKKINRWYSRHGHTGQDDSYDIASKIIAEVGRLAA